MYPEDFLRNAKQKFPRQSLGSFSKEYYNIENKILGFQFETVCAKQTHPNCSVGSNQDEAGIQHDRLSTQEWCKCEKCEKMSNNFKCVCSRKIPEVQAFPLKCKTRLSWNTSCSGIFLQNVWN